MRMATAMANLTVAAMVITMAFVKASTLAMASVTARVTAFPLLMEKHIAP